MNILNKQERTRNYKPNNVAFVYLYLKKNKVEIKIKMFKLTLGKCLQCLNFSKFTNSTLFFYFFHFFTKNSLTKKKTLASLT